MPIAARPVGKASRFGMWCRRNPVVAGAAALVLLALVGVSVLSLVYAQQQSRLASTLRLYGNEQKQRATEQATATGRISAQASELKKQGQDLRTSLVDTNRRLAMLNFERAQRAFDGGQVSHGLLYLVECWRYADKANDSAWQHLARANISYWRYGGVEAKGKFSQNTASKDSFSPDGKTIVIQEGPKTARLWSISNERPIGRPMIHPDFLDSMIFSPNGKSILTVGRDNAIRLWDAANGTPIGQPIRVQSYPSTVTFSPDAKTFICHTSNSTAQLWNASTERLVCQFPHASTAWTQGVTFSPDGKIVLCRVDGGGRRLRDAATGRPIGDELNHKLEIWSAEFSPNGKLVVTASLDGTARLWDASTGSPVGPPMVHHYPVISAQFSPDGGSILTASRDMSSRLWRTETSLPRGPTVQHGGSDERSPDCNMSFSSDGSTFLLWFPGFTKVYLGDAASGLPFGKSLEHRAEVSSAAFSPDAKVILSGSKDGSLRL